MFISAAFSILAKTNKQVYSVINRKKEIPTSPNHHSSTFIPEDSYDFDVIVVGAGISGAVCAYSLAKKGHEVLLIERGSQS